MRRLLSAIVAAGFVLVTAGIPAQAEAAGGTADARSPAEAAGGTAPGTVQAGRERQPARPAAAPRPDPAGRIRLDITGLTPRTVTAQGPGVVSVTGRVTNTSDRRIDDIAVRLQRGDAVTSEDRLRAVLRDPPATERASSRWAAVGDSLGPGESRDFQVDAPLQGAPGGSLQINERGIYPLLINVNGQPDHGGQARLAAMSTLLPVLSLPGGPPAAKPPTPAAITMLWPLADRPRLVETPPGEQPLLTDDELAGSLAVGGRLSNLLQALESASGNAALSSSLCLAVDPDLLVTAQVMTNGYRVRAGDRVVPGRGAESAKQWLARLRAFVAGHCVMALPYADADLVALSRSGQGSLQRLALDGADVVRDLLKPAQPLTGVVWPAEGGVDDRTLGDLAAGGTGSVLLSQDELRPAPGSQPVALQEGRSRVRAVRLDPLLAAALGGASGQSRTPGVTPSADDPSIAAQSGLAALAFRTAFQADPGRSMVIAPSRRWNATAAELGALLDAVQNLYTERLAIPTPLGQLTGGPMPAQPAALNYPTRETPPGIPGSIVDDVTAASSTLGDLTGAMERDDRSNIEPPDFTTPFARNLLRTESAVWRGDDGSARRALHDATEQLAALQSKVTVVPPTNPLSWASGDSLLPAVVNNELPVHMKVRVVLGDTQGVRPQPYDTQRIPAMGSRTLYIPVQVLRSGRLSVDVRLTTPQGMPLGTAARFEATSTAYGTITIVITVTAAVALVLLAARRIYRRVHPSGRPAEAVPVGGAATLPVHGPAVAPDVPLDGRTHEGARRGRPETAPRPAAGVPGEEGSSRS